MTTRCPAAPAALLVRPGDRAMRMGMIGEGAGRRPRERGEVWIVVHAAGVERWTHLYRIDPRDPRTVHLLRAGAGDRAAAFAGWAAEVLGVETFEALRRLAA